MELVKYNNAKQAIAACVDIDECKGWSDKAAAMRAYAKMRDDEEMENNARRIRARASRRIGELLSEVEPDKGGYAGRYARGGAPSQASPHASRQPKTQDFPSMCGSSAYRFPKSPTTNSRTW
jgi:hypothetical protein